MRIGILSDTHGHLPRALLAVEQLAHLEVDLVIHCGDIGSPTIIDLFASWPTHFVFGNVDDPQTLRKLIAQAGQTCHERFGQLRLHGKRIAFLHGDDHRLLRETTESGHWNLVCCGHTHRATIAEHNHVLVVNPGALYRTTQPSVAVVDLPFLTARIVTIP